MHCRLCERETAMQSKYKLISNVHSIFYRDGMKANESKSESKAGLAFRAAAAAPTNNRAAPVYTEDRQRKATGIQSIVAKNKSV
jgi:hypothetical protein